MLQLELSTAMVKWKYDTWKLLQVFCVYHITTKDENLDVCDVIVKLNLIKE